jgi:cyclopropane-fatty-acyl-phospholipid synthase
VVTGLNTSHGYRGSSAEAVQQHYDLSNDFYGLWLDPGRSYSCALWADGDTLESAQNRKLDYLIGEARAAGAERVLDVGCGWGGLLARLTEHHGVRHAVGLTLSREQAAWIEGLGRPRCEVRLQNWIEHPADERYDAIISIGAFEHFARSGLSRAERIAGYREFFQRCRAWLPPGGRLALQTCVKGNNPRVDRKTARDMLFVNDLIFPETEIPRPSEVLEASENIFDPTVARNDPDHYARTTREWHDRLRARRDEAVELVGAEQTASYLRYLGAVSDHFHRRHIGLLRITFEAV